MIKVIMRKLLAIRIKTSLHKIFSLLTNVMSRKKIKVALLIEDILNRSILQISEN